jgi:hypothetical protein
MSAKTRMLLAAAILSLPCLASAQAFTSKTAATTLTVNLTALSGIRLNAAGLNPTLNYLTDADYTNGVTLSQTAALSTFSTSAYSVTIYATTQLVNTTNSAISIPAGDVTVTPSLAVANPDITITPKAIPVAIANATKLIGSTSGTVLQNFNLAYSTVGAPTTDFINKPAGAYATTITYTITNP